MAVSPIYLESLKTYEQFAGGDSLFQRAIDQFHLRDFYGKRPFESVKRKVLKVLTVRNTRILEVAVTLPDPRKAQALAEFLAKATVDLNRSLVSDGDQDLLQGITQQEREMRASLDAIEASWARVLSEEPVADLQAAMSKASELRTTLQQQILNTQLEIADAAERQKTASAAEQAEARKESANAGARLAEMRNQLREIEGQSKDREKLLAVRMAHRDKLEADRKAGQTALAGIETRLREARGDAGYRGERLKIIDPGIVPERPSSPNMPLNVAAALLLGLVLPILYLTLEMNYQEYRISERRNVYRTTAKARDE